MLRNRNCSLMVMRMTVGGAVSRKVQPASRHAVRKALQHNENGYPKLPLPRQQNAKLAEDKELIRAFMTMTYRKCYVTMIDADLKVYQGRIAETREPSYLGRILLSDPATT